MDNQAENIFAGFERALAWFSRCNREIMRAKPRASTLGRARKAKILSAWFVITAALFVWASMISPASAQIVPACGPDGAGPCTLCDFWKLGNNIINFLLWGLAIPILTVLLLWGGTVWATSTGSPGRIEQGKKIMTTGLVGILIALSAWLVVDTLIKTLAADGEFKAAWNKFPECAEPIVEQEPGAISFQAGSAGTTTLTGNCQGTQCADYNVPICSVDASANCSFSQVNAWDTQIQTGASGKQICSGVDTVKLIKAIVSQESGGRHNLDASDGLSYGILQMQTSTANAFKSGCTTANIDAAWLKDADNVEESVCIAINYLKSLVGPCGCDAGQLAAGYNGGGAALGACAPSTSCASCSICQGQQTRRWECLWDGPDGEHLQCNKDNSGGSFAQTRKYVPRVRQCYSQY